MKEERLFSLDLLRGLILVLMAIDHASYFIGRIHFLEFWGLPLPRYETSAAFLIRLITHLCAPGFFFLLGTGMILLAESRGKMEWSENQITRYFLKRGLVLLLLQFFAENPAWFIGQITDRTNRSVQAAVAGSGENVWIHFGVLFALGSSMAIWAFLRRLKSPVIFILSLLFMSLSQILLPSADKVSRIYTPLARILVIPGRTGVLQVFYPVIPWLGFTGLGMIFGRVIVRRTRDAFRLARAAGIIAVILFIAVRILENPGDLSKPFYFTCTGFLGLTKYPPEPAFMLLTLGFCLILLWLLSRCGKICQNRRNPLLVFGRVPMFFYLAHLYFFALAGFFFPHGSGYMVMFSVWFAVLAVLYFLCDRYAVFKFKKPLDSLWRFF